MNGPDEPEPYEVKVDEGVPAIVVFTGAEIPVLLFDDGNSTAISEGWTEIERAVIVARLRTWADVIEKADR